MEVTNTGRKVALLAALRAMAYLTNNADHAASLLTVQIMDITKSDVTAMTEAAAALAETLEEIRAERSGTAASVFSNSATVG